jgi:3-phosphoshikimate 1-carboxyvinyltransferase
VNLVVSKSSLKGRVPIPASKSHTIRGLVIASLAEGASRLIAPLDSQDTRSCVRACRALGARIETGADWEVTGTAGNLATPDDVVDVGNSGTTLCVTLGAAALGDGYTVFTGDEQIRRRPLQPLVNALEELGAQVYSTRNNGLPPVVARGRIKGGRCFLDAVSSQYLTSLLINTPLAEADTEIDVGVLNEAPYVEMTLRWLGEQGIRYSQEDLKHFVFPGGQRYHAFGKRIPADFSSATFFLCAGAITDADLTLEGLDMNDPQGDKAVVGMLEEMGARVDVEHESIRIRPGDLAGRTLDLNSTPDALPALAVVGCLARGKTRLENVPQARLKETDRIHVMAEELSKMGATIRELPAGLEIEGGGLNGAKVSGHSDHRVVMALTVAGMAAQGETEVDTAEAAAVTFPSFLGLMQSVGASIGVKQADQNTTAR